MSGNYGWNISGVSMDFISHERPDRGSDDDDNVPNFPQAPAVKGYYWCESAGEIPSGAIKVGVDKDGGNVFVGRAFHEGDVLPAKVISNQNTAYVAWGGSEHPKREFEVLCRGGCTVIWQESSGGSVPPDAVPVGSTNDGERLFIGRVFHDGTLTPGKIHPSHGVCYIPYNGEELNFPTYEVLVMKNC